MKVVRFEGYEDERFSKKNLLAHTCFLVDGKPCEVEIISHHEAIIHLYLDDYLPLCEEFRFYGEHIDTFYNEKLEVVYQCLPVSLQKVSIVDIQPSQFIVDDAKVEAILSFVKEEKDIIIPITYHEGKMISLDGHSRLYVAILKGFQNVYVFEADSFPSILDFVDACKDRGIYSPYDLKAVMHEEYKVFWEQFCNELFMKKNFQLM